MATGLPVQFGRIPYAVIDAGFVARMKPADVAVYLVIAGHSRPQLTAYPGLDRIAKLAGIARPTVCKAISRLKCLGVLAVESGGGCKNPNRYTLLIPNGHPVMTVPPGETVIPEAAKQSSANGQTVIPQTLNGHPPLTGTENEQMEQNSNRRAAVLCELERQGIGEPTRGQLLVKLPGLKVAIVRELAGRVRNATNPAGLLVRKLESDGAELIKRAGDRQAAATCNRQADEDHKRECERQALELRAIIDGLSDTDLERHKADVLADPSISQFKRNRWRKEDPRKNTGLMRAIRDRLIMDT